MSKFSLEAIIKAQDRFSRPIAKMQTNVARFTRSAQSGLKHVDAMASRMHKTLKAAAIGAVPVAVGAGFIGKSIIDTGADFEAALSSVAAVSGASAAELDKLKLKAMELGRTTKFSGTEVVGAMEAMVKSGFKVDETLAGVGGILSAAAADGGSIEDTAASIMASMKGLGLGPEKMQGFADMLAKAGDSTAASIGTLTESMAKFGPVARQLGVPVESAIAQLALLQDAGLDASTAGTSLASVYSKLAAPVGATKIALKKLGIEVKDINGNMKPPDELMAGIIKATDGIEGNVGKMAAITNLVGLESQKALLNIAAAAKDGKLDALTKALLESAGYAEKLADMRTDNFRGDLTNLDKAIDSVKNSIYDMNKGPLREVTQSITKWINANEGLIASKATEFVVEFRENLPEIVTWTKRIGVGIGIFYGVSLAIKAAQTALIVYNGLVRGAALVTAGYRLVTKSAAAATVFSTGVTWARNTAQLAMNASTGAGTGALGLFTGATSRATAATAAGTPAIWAGAGAMRAMAASAGAAAAAVGSVMLAMDQADKLAKETGGLGITGTIGEMWERGTWDPFEAVDAHMNDQARAAAAARKLEPKLPKIPNADHLVDIGFDAKSLESLDALTKTLGAPPAPVGVGRVTAMDRSGATPSPQVIHSSEREIVLSDAALRQIVERTRNESELIIRDETGRGELHHKKGNGKHIRVQKSGGV